MRCALIHVALAALLIAGCSGKARDATLSTENAVVQNVHIADAKTPPASPALDAAVAGGFRGFDRNTYPGDIAMKAMRDTFAFTGYWLTSPPGASRNTWKGKRELLKSQGWGFLALANGRLDAQILASRKRGISPDALGRQDAATAISSARVEAFPPKTIIFLDQEEGGRLLPEQAAYLLAWTEAIAASEYRPGVYANGQLVEDDPGVMIDTIRDIRERVKLGKLHDIAIFDAQDACPPAPGCSVNARPIDAAGEPDLTAWQYSQSPRRPEITRACAATYAQDGNCYAPGHPGLFLDMDLATSPDPSHGR